MPDILIHPDIVNTINSLIEISQKRSTSLNTRNTCKDAANIIGRFAEDLDAAYKEISRLQSALRDAQAQHRTEYCEEAQYDCVLLGKERQLREMYANELTKVRRERCELRKLCRENGLLPGIE